MTAGNGDTGLRVLVRRAGGYRPVPAATLTVLDGAGAQVARGQGGDDGVFRAGLPRPGEYLLIAAADGHEPRSVTLSLRGPGEHDVELALPGRHGGVAGTVAGPDGPAGGATVVVHDMRGEVAARATTGDDGRYAVSGLPPAVYTVVAVAPGTEPVTDTVVVDTSGDARWDTALPAASTGLTGTVRTADGHPVPDARVALLRPDGTAVAVAGTDPEGRYAFPGLPAGDYTVVATGYPPTTEVLHVGDGGATLDPVLRHPEVS